MASKISSKVLNSKNIVRQIVYLYKKDNLKLIEEILKQKELKNFLPQIKAGLTKTLEKEGENKETKVFSKTPLSDELIKSIQKTAKVKFTSYKAVIDENLSPGVKIKQGNMLIDATFETMLGTALENSNPR